MAARKSDCTIVVVSGGLEFTLCDAPSQVLVVTELRELVFHLERATLNNTGVCLRNVLAYWASPKDFLSRQVHLIALS